MFLHLPPQPLAIQPRRSRQLAGRDHAGRASRKVRQDEHRQRNQIHIARLRPAHMLQQLMLQHQERGRPADPLRPTRRSRRERDERRSVVTQVCQHLLAEIIITGLGQGLERPQLGEHQPDQMPDPRRRHRFRLRRLHRLPQPFNPAAGSGNIATAPRRNTASNVSYSSTETPRAISTTSPAPTPARAYARARAFDAFARSA